jgi:hypothetical protein
MALAKALCKKCGARYVGEEEEFSAERGGFWCRKCQGRECVLVKVKGEPPRPRNYWEK